MVRQTAEAERNAREKAIADKIDFNALWADTEEESGEFLDFLIEDEPTGETGQKGKDDHPNLAELLWEDSESEEEKKQQDPPDLSGLEQALRSMK